MLPVVFSQNFNLAAQVIIGATNKLKFADISVLLHVLAQYLGPTLVVTLDDFEQASFIVGLQILVHDDRSTLVVRAHNPSINTTASVLFEFAPAKNCIAAVFKETFAFMWAVNHLLETINS